MTKFYATTSALACAIAGLGAQSLAAQSPETQPSAAANDVRPQQGGTGSALADNAGEIVVTGSRLRTGFDTPTPVTMVGEAVIAQRAPSAIAEVLLELPAFRNSNSQTGNQFTINTAGQNILDLRGLGSVRTLVLVDSRRFVPTSTTTNFDTNLIPTSLVERTAVVTGGASAQYGSDAVAGVVNFVLKDKLEGLHLVGQYGQTPHDDNREMFGSLGWGTSFADDRGHLIVGAEYSDSRGVGVGVGPYARDWGRREFGLVTLPANRPAGLPSQIISDQVEYATASFGSLIVGSTTHAGTASSLLRGTAFGPNGSVVPFTYGSVIGTNTMIGSTTNYGTIPTAPQVLKVPNERFSTLARVNFAVSEGLTLFAEGSYGYQIARTNTSYNFFTNLVINADNAFLPDAIRQSMQSNNLRSITIGRIDRDIGAARAENSNRTYRIVAGAKGKLFADIDWDAYFEHGENKYENDVFNAPKTANYRAAISAVRDGSGQIICGPLATNPNLTAAQRAVVQPGCVPFNVFGEGSPSAASVSYVSGLEYNHVTSRQDAAGVNVAGSILPLPAGPLSFALGGEYRKDRANGQTPLEAQQNLFAFGNYKPINGAISVYEGYAEIGAPIFRDSPIGRSLDFNAAIRLTDYSTSGSVTTWKAGATYEPIDAIRLRVTRSRDIRAPNISDIFTVGGGGLNQITNPANGVQAQVQTINRGNPNLTPEIANTWTAGIVLAPTGRLRGLRASVDYYDIQIKDAISSVAAQDIVNRCAAGQTAYCASINYDPAAGNGIASVINQPFNANTLKTSGVDFELAYTSAADELIPSLPGSLSIRALATHLRQLETFDPSGASLGNQAGATLGKWRGNVALTYAGDRFSVTLTNRFFSSVKYSVTLIGPEDAGYSPSLTNSISKNRFPGGSYTSLSMSYNLWNREGRKAQIFGIIDNLFDRDPPYGAVLIGNSSPYDVVGISFKAGVRVDL